MSYELENEGSEEGGYVADLVPVVAQALASGVLGSRAQVEAEIDVMLRAVREFWQMEPDEVGRLCQAMSARCTELAVHLQRVETQREWKRIRTMQIVPLIDEMKRQWAIASRLIELRRQDLELLK